MILHSRAHDRGKVSGGRRKVKLGLELFASPLHKTIYDLTVAPNTSGSRNAQNAPPRRGVGFNREHLLLFSVNAPRAHLPEAMSSGGAAE